MSFVVGIDFSMTCPSITLMQSDDSSFTSCKIGYLLKTKPKQLHPNIQAFQLKKYGHDTERFDLISEWAVEFIKKNTSGVVRIYIEDYAFGAVGKVFQMGEAGGMLKHKLYRAGYNFICIPPTVIKKFATGSGAARKEAMYAAFSEQTDTNLKALYQPNKEDIDSPLGDIVDSFFICAYGQTNPAEIPKKPRKKKKNKELPKAATGAKRGVPSANLRSKKSI